MITVRDARFLQTLAWGITTASADQMETSKSTRSEAVLETKKYFEQGLLICIVFTDPDTNPAFSTIRIRIRFQIRIQAKAELSKTI
jgi:hypothetical protein